MKLRSMAVLAIAVLSIALMSQLTPAQSATPYPVTYSFLADVLANGQRESAPGANDWKCRPTAAKPRPVVLVHGTAGNAATNWGTYSALLANEGYCVFALTYGVVPTSSQPVKFGGIDDMRVSAQQLAAFVAKVRRTTGAAKVDLIGHSQGTLMPNYYVRFLRGYRYVKNYVSLAPVWHGEGGSGIAGAHQMLRALGVPFTQMPVCKSCPQLLAGSEFMDQMRTGRIAHKWVSYTNIVTRYENVVIPYTAGIQTGYPNMRNIVLQDVCPTDFSDHLQIAASANAARLALNALDPAHAKPVKCRLHLPALG